MNIDMNTKLGKRFWSKVDIKSDDECWNFKGAKSNGYGYFKIDKRNHPAHRIAWDLFYCLKVPPKGFICHHCDNPPCCNPAHLYLGTHATNMLDVTNRNKSTKLKQKTLCSGEVWLIRKLMIPIGNSKTKRKYKFSGALVSKMFKVDQSTIHNIWRIEKYLCKDGVYA